MEVIKALIEARKIRGLTQRQLAEKVGIKQPQLARIESGKQSPTIRTLVGICEALDYSLEIVVVRDENEPST